MHCELGIQQAAAPRSSESVNSRSGSIGDDGVHSKKITELFDYTFLAIADVVKRCHLERREKNEKEMGVMVRVIKEGDTDGMNMTESANNGAA